MRRLLSVLCACVMLLGFVSQVKAEEASPVQEMSKATMEMSPATSGPVNSGYLELHLQLDGTTRPVPVLDGGFSHSLSKYGLGISGYFWLMDGWGEAYFGPTYKPVDWFQFGLYVGGELNSDYKIQARYAASACVCYSPFFFTGFVEWNNAAFRGDEAGVWYDLVLKVVPKKWIGVGWRARRGVGLGPYLEFNLPIPELPMTLWASYVPFDPEGSGQYWNWNKAMVGVIANF